MTRNDVSCTDEVAKKNKTFKIKDVEQLTKAEMEKITPELWKKCCDHVIKLEQIFVDKEKIVDEYFMEINENNRIVITAADDASDYDDDDETEDEEDNYCEEEELLDV